MDEESLLACVAHVDLNPIRAALAETLETSDHTSVQRRIEAQQQEAALERRESQDASADVPAATETRRDPSCSSADRFLAPVEIDESGIVVGACCHRDGTRCSDKGFLAMSVTDYLECSTGPHDKPSRTSEARRRRMFHRFSNG